MRESKHDHQFDNLDKLRSKVAEEDLMSCCVERKVTGLSNKLEAGLDEV